MEKKTSNMKEYQKQYYEKHREKVLEKLKNEVYTCELCNCVVKKNNKTKHNMTIRHQHLELQRDYHNLLNNRETFVTNYINEITQ